MGSPADRSEIAIVTLFRSRARIQCPAVAIVGIPNAAKRSQWAAAQAKREGLASGFPDMMCLAAGRGGALVAFIEWKTARGRASANQIEWLARLRRLGFEANIFSDPDEALVWLRELGFPFLCEAAAA